MLKTWRMVCERLATPALGCTIHSVKITEFKDFKVTAHSTELYCLLDIINFTIDYINTKKTKVFCLDLGPPDSYAMFRYS